MTRLGDVARIVIAELNHEGVNHESPLEDQAVLVYRAVRRFAEVNRWPPRTYQDRAGKASNFIMKRMVEDLFPDAEKELLETISSNVNIVLRRTYACYCIRRHTATDNPVWFVADEQPANITDVALGVAARGGGHRARAAFDEDTYLRTNERRLTPEEAGEDRDPGEVTMQPVPSAFQARQDRLREEFERDAARVYDEIATNPQPLTAVDVATLTNMEMSRTRHILNSLYEDGKVVYRIESHTEKAIRVAVGLPAGRRARLYVPAPGPVPKRTELPPGIGITTSMTEHHAKNKEARDDLVQKIMAFLENEAVGEQRRLGKIAEAAGTDKDTAKATMARMIRWGMIHRTDAGRYYIGKNGNHTRRVESEEDVIAKLKAEHEATLPRPAQPATVPEATVPEGMDPRIAHILTSLADVLSEQASGPSPREGELEQKVKELEALAAKQSETISHLRAAIANLGD